MSVATPIGTFGTPADAVAIAALVAAVAAAIWWRGLTQRIPVAALAIGAGLLSLGYVAFYLRGGPRIIDATSYWLQARALAEGSLAFSVPESLASFSGRFSIVTPEHRLAVIFPPGYPALLALGFLAGAPMAVGPAIAIALVFATWHLGRQLFDDTVARFAALVSAVCAALRYHTADTMSHGFAALLVAVAVSGALARSRWGPAFAGLAVGGLLCTRPVTGAACAIAVGLLLGGASARRIPLALAFAVPGASLLLLHQHAATGSWLGSTQLHYYAHADGPPGCFGWGFGAVGCQFEHGEFVRANLPDGYGAREAALTTLRRLRYHTLDVASFEPLALLVPFAMAKFWRHRGARALTLCILSTVALYAPFYFDGNYPGGGARMFADVLPLEHVLLAAAAVELRWQRWVVPASLAGFAMHASFDHQALRDREGGRPMFDDAIADGDGNRLVFVDTDHGFNLGHRPGDRSFVVARLTGGAHDRHLWDHLERPTAYRYRYFFDGTPPRLEPFEPPATRWYEAEAHWPPRQVLRGWVHPAFPRAGCPTNGKGLRLRDGARVRVALPDPSGRAVETRWVAVGGGLLQVRLETGGIERRHQKEVRPGECLVWSSPPVEASKGGILTVSVSGAEAVLDAYAFSRGSELPGKGVDI